MKFYNILFGLLILTLNGCGDAVTSSTNDKSSTINLSNLNGTWIQECQFDASDSTSYKESYVFSSSTYTATNSVTYYSDSACSTQSFSINYKIYNMYLGAKSTTTNDIIINRFFATLSDLTIKPLSSTVASALNSIAYCGITSWVSDIESSIAGLTCSSSTMVAANSSFINIVQMNSEMTYIRFGNFSEVDSDGYPTTLYSNLYYKYN